MEEFVRKVLSRYTSFVSEKQLYERWLDMRENSDVRDALVMTDMKITMIQSWFNLLNADECFVIEKHLLDELEWPRVAFSFTKKWDGEFTRTERSLVAYQASGLKKIIRSLKLIEIWSWHSLAIFTRKRTNKQANNPSSRPCKRAVVFTRKSISVFLHHFFLNTSIFKTTIFAYNISAPREKV